MAEPIRVRDRWLTEPHPSRVDPTRPNRDRILARHRAAVEAGQLGYADPATGLWVMTATYLRERDQCCDRGCRHCPYVGADDRPERAPR